MTTTWIEASVRVERAHADVIESLLNGQGALAVTLTDHGDTPIWEAPVGETPLWGDVVVTGLFDADTNATALARVLSLAPGIEGPASVNVTGVEDRDWVRVWLDRFEPMRFGEDLWIVPTGKDCPDPEATIIRLDPGLAFGTGTHTTTRLCLEWIAGQDLRGATVLDYGCGSGVLGIAAALRGAERVLCQDNDPQAVVATLDNARRNGVEDRIVAEQAENPAGEPVDVVISNILAGILVKLAAPLQAMAGPGARLALTGILRDQANDVATAFSGRFPSLQRTTIEDWVLLTGSAEWD